MLYRLLERNVGSVDKYLISMHLNFIPAFILSILFKSCKIIGKKKEVPFEGWRHQPCESLIKLIQGYCLIFSRRLKLESDHKLFCIDLALAWKISRASVKTLSLLMKF